jgi:hypothetical protein
MKAEIQGFVESQIFFKLFTQKFTLLLSQDLLKFVLAFTDSLSQQQSYGFRQEGYSRAV